MVKADVEVLRAAKDAALRMTAKNRKSDQHSQHGLKPQES